MALKSTIGEGRGDSALAIRPDEAGWPLPAHTAGSGSANRGVAAIAADYLALTKPRILMMCIIVTIGGLLMVPQSVSLGLALATLLGTALSVAGACALNMVLERDYDAQMERTKDRPVAAGRISVQGGYLFSIGCGIAGLVILGTLVNPLSAGLAGLAYLSYTLVYTPLKSRTEYALFAGLLPGAIPALIGSAAASAELSAAGSSLFVIMLVWQMAHAVPLSIVCQDSYQKAGIRCISASYGERFTVWATLGSTAFLAAVTTLPLWLNGAGWVYALAAVVLNGWLLLLAAKGFGAKETRSWARGFFIKTMIYIAGLNLALMLDRVLPLPL